MSILVVLNYKMFLLNLPILLYLSIVWTLYLAGIFLDFFEMPATILHALFSVRIFIQHNIRL